MSVKTLFPRTLVACFVLSLLALNTAAQTDFARPRQAVTQPTEINDASNRLENDLFVVSTADEAADGVDEAPAAALLKPSFDVPGLPRFDRMLVAAIDRRLGAPYVFGATGPRVFDCSGFVWSVFQSAGISFERTNARTFWNTFQPVREGEQYRLGTLVFFNNLKHVGIVADANGFYHASTSHGVTYSTFNDYWTSRITGFRRIPLPTQSAAE